MFKRTIAAMLILAVTICFGVNVDASDARHTKDDTWLVYWYICGSDLESNGHTATRNIAEMQQVKLPPNVKVLIATGGAKQWHHPTIATGGDGIYLYSGSRLEKQADWKTNAGNIANMGAPATLTTFLKYGEDNFDADHKIIIFSNHGGLGGVCYDDNFKGDGLSYDELNKAFADLYGSSPEEQTFELVGFDACMTASYELANSISDFSRYMLGSEPNSNGLDFKAFFSALAKDSSLNGYQIGKTICDSSMNLYKNLFKDEDLRLYDNALSVIDLTKMPELREAYEAYFNEALNRSNEEEGFSGAFARAAEARTADRYSNLYTDLGLLAKNTKSIMPDTSNKLIKAINKAVVYNKRGAYLKSKGISTYYPYISQEGTAEESVASTNKGFEANILSQKANYDAQKDLYQKLLNLKDLPTSKDLPLEKNSTDHFVTKLMPEQLENISYVRCILLPVKKGDNSSTYGLDLGGAILTSADDLKVDWKKGTVTENFRDVEPVFDGHKIVTLPSLSGRGHSFYKVPIIYNEIFRRDLIVRYDTSTKKYDIIGFGSTVENGVVRSINGKPQPGVVITPIHIILSDDPSNEAMGVEIDERTGEVRKVPVIDKETGKPVIDEKTGKPKLVPKYAPSIISTSVDPNTGKPIYLKYTKGTPFVFTRDSAITNRQITRGNFFYFFAFTSPGGYGSTSEPGLINVEYGEVTKFTREELQLLAEIMEEPGE